MIIADNWCVDTSNSWDTLIDSAFVSVVTRLWNVDTSYGWMADISGALVVIRTSSLLVPAIWDLAICMFTNKAIIVSIAFLPVSVLAKVVAFGSCALSDLLGEALS
jgi:hypothetical protein